MARRDMQEPTRTEGTLGGDVEVHETHPAFGLARFGRRSCTPGQVLFDSEIRHGSTVVLTINRGERIRSLKHDRFFDRDNLIEVEMSEAQFGALVSSFGNGTGVPVTIRRTETDWRVPEFPFSARTALSIKETEDSAERAFSKIKAAAEAVQEKPTKANIRDLMIQISNGPKNVAFAAKSLTEHVENVVTKARSDIEGMVATHAATLGITAADMPTFALNAGDEVDVVDGEFVDADEGQTDEHGYRPIAEGD